MLFGLDPSYVDLTRNVSRIVIVTNKEIIRQELDKISINQSTLFPDIQNTATHLKSKF